jgi:hypothetical protein
MPPVVRPTSINDAHAWKQLLLDVIGAEYADDKVYEPEWIGPQLNPESGNVTWVAENDGRLMASISLLSPTANNPNPIFNLGRQLFHQASFTDGSAELLLRHVLQLAAQHGQWTVARIQASDNQMQLLFEQHGFICAGYQPSKHRLEPVSGTLFYVHPGHPEIQARLPVSESLSQVSELAARVLYDLGVAPPPHTRDGATGYPLKVGLKIHEASFDDFELWRQQAQSANPLIELSTGYNLGSGYLRVLTNQSHRVLLGQRDDRMVCGLAYCVDAVDNCLRLIDSYALDDLSTGALLLELTRRSLETWKAAYVEMDVLMSAPRLLKTAEQLGFLPVAYLPAFFVRQGRCEDVVKMVKLNHTYVPEQNSLTTQAARVAEIVDLNFQDLRVGVAVISLLRSLPFFDGLGDGELRKMARLFEQKLYRAGDFVFRQRDSSNEAYIVLRGQVDIFIDNLNKPIASMKPGQVFGEQAFLDNAPRVASAATSQPSILLVIKQSAFFDLVQHEPHLGMVIMRNVAVELSQKLRQADLNIHS